MSYLVLKSDTHTVAKQAKEATRCLRQVTSATNPPVIDTYGGYGD